MANAYLGVGIACPGKLVQYFGINHGPASLQFVFMEKVGRIEFESTIDIAYRDAEDHANQHFPTPCIDPAHPCILAINPISQHGIVFFYQWEELLKVMNIKLSIRIHEKSQVPGDCFKATYQSRAISLVYRVMYYFQAWMCCGNSIQDHASVILTSIINNDDFKI